MARINDAMVDLMRYTHTNNPKERSLFDKSHSHATTLDSAFLVPIMWDRVIPGDEKKIRYSGLARMATPLHPVMDEAWLYTWAFYCPDRLWWSNAKAFYGENLDAEYNDDGEYQMPSITAREYLLEQNDLGSLSDYFGLPFNSNNFNFTGIDSDSLDKTRVCGGLWRMYQIIWNEFFRNSSIQPSVPINLGDYIDANEWARIKQIRTVCKIPDQFTSLLLSPQAGEDVLLPLGEFAPVITRPEMHTFGEPSNFYGLKILYPNMPVSESMTYSVGGFVYADSEAVAPNPLGITSGTPSDVNDYSENLVPTNLWADLSLASSTSINNLRSAITIQQLLEKDAIGGKRYQSLIYAHYGCFTADGVLQRPELLGATKTRIGMRQVLSTAETGNGDNGFVGNTGAFSVTNIDNEWICNKGFTEPGYIMVLTAIRPLHSYSQGVNPLLRKLNRYDHYYPVFENIGNQPVYTSEVFANGYFVEDMVDTFSDVFGWKEAWQEYRFMNNRVSGLFRPDVNGSLASWNYTSYFTEKPFLDSKFVSEDPYLIDRTIIATNEPQFLLDNYFEYHDIKNMGVHSYPGLTRL